MANFRANGRDWQPVIKASVAGIAALVLSLSLSGCSVGSADERALEATGQALVQNKNGDGFLDPDDLVGIRCHDPDQPEEEQFVGDDLKRADGESSFSRSTECTAALSGGEYRSFMCDVKFPSENARAKDASVECEDKTDFFERMSGLAGTGYFGEEGYRNSANQVE